MWSTVARHERKRKLGTPWTFKLWYPDCTRPRSALVLQVSVNKGVKKNSASTDTGVNNWKNTVPESSDEDNVTSDSHIEMFECWEPGCVQSFQTFSELESHLNIGDHYMKEDKKGKTPYNQVRMDFADMFTRTVKITEEAACARSTQQTAPESSSPSQIDYLGWALPKPRPGPSRLSYKVKKYLTERFDLSEQTGLKADPQQVTNDMRKTRDEQNNRCLTERSGCPRAKCRVSFPASRPPNKDKRDPQK